MTAEERLALQEKSNAKLRARIEAEKVEIEKARQEAIERMRNRLTAAQGELS